MNQHPTCKRSQAMSIILETSILISECPEIAKAVGLECCTSPTYNHRGDAAGRHSSAQPAPSRSDSHYPVSRRRFRRVKLGNDRIRRLSSYPKGRPAAALDASWPSSTRARRLSCSSIVLGNLEPTALPVLPLSFTPRSFAYFEMVCRLRPRTLAAWSSELTRPDSTSWTNSSCRPLRRPVLPGIVTPVCFA